MKTVEEKVIHFLHTNCAALASLTFSDSQELQYSLTRLLKEQDRDTRHACAEAVILLDGEMNGPPFGCSKMILAEEAHAACINVKVC